jgi:hypothetical protein
MPSTSRNSLSGHAVGSLYHLRTHLAAVPILRTCRRRLGEALGAYSTRPRARDGSTRDVRAARFRPRAAEEGRVRSAGRIRTRRQELELFAQSLGSEDEVALDTTGRAARIAEILRPRRAGRGRQREEVAPDSPRPRPRQIGSTRAGWPSICENQRSFSKPGGCAPCGCGVASRSRERVDNGRCGAPLWRTGRGPLKGVFPTWVGPRPPVG